MKGDENLPGSLILFPELPESLVAQVLFEYPLLSQGSRLTAGTAKVLAGVVLSQWNNGIEVGHSSSPYFLCQLAFNKVNPKCYHESP